MQVVIKDTPKKFFSIPSSNISSHVDASIVNFILWLEAQTIDYIRDKVTVSQRYFYYLTWTLAISLISIITPTSEEVLVVCVLRWKYFHR